jgi:hypothetical protein
MRKLLLAFVNRLTPTLLALLLCITAASADDPYKEGVRDYYSGLCYRARPDSW